MSSKQAFFGLIALTVLVVAITGLTVTKGGSMLTSKGEALTDLKLTSEVLEDRQAVLLRAKQDIVNYAELETIAKSIVPQEKDQARTVRELVAIAGESGVSLSSIQFPSSALGGLQQGGRASARKAPAQSSETSQLTPVPSITGLYAMEITAQSNPDQPVTYGQLLDFLERLEQNRRTAHVTSLTIVPQEGDRNLVTFTVILNVYIKP